MRIFHLIFCLAFGFLGAHRFIVRQKMHGLLFLLLSIFTILFIGNPATEYIADISLTVLLVLIAIDAITVLLTGRYIAFESNKKAEDNDMKSRGEALDTDSLQHKIMCVRISKSIKQGLNVYDAARYAWKVSEQSTSDVDFVLGVDDGIVVGVFKPNTWLPGDHPDFQSLNGYNNQYSNRFGFIGKDAEKKVKNLYLNKTIQEMAGKQSGQNPVRFFGSTNNAVNQANVQKTSNETVMPRSVPRAQNSNPSAPKTLVLIAYEINAETAKKLIQKGLGISANLKKFNSSEIIEHVASAWSSIEDVMYEQGISPLYKILYTAKLSDPLRIGQSRNDIINNSFLMSVISDNSMFGRQAIDGARFYDFRKHSDFEKKQLSIFLDEIGDRFSAQEIGIFCWIEIEKDLADPVVKQIASHFAPEKSGELHFLEFTHDGRILPNFANVSTQKFEGKLAGNFTLSLAQEEYQEGMDRLNTITETVVGSLVFDTANEQPSGAELGSETEKEVKTKKSYSDDFKRQVALAANQDGATLTSVGQQFDVSPTLVRNWKNKFSEDPEEIQMQDKSNSNDDVSINDIQNWLQSAQVEGTIDGDGDLYASLELSEEVITDKPNKIYLIGSQKLASGGKSETFDFESEVTTNEANWLRSDYLNGVDKDDPNFALNMKLVCHACLDLLTIPVTVKEGKISDFPQKVGNIKVSELSIILEDGDYRLEGRLDGENGFIYGIEASTEEPDDEQSPRAAKVVDDENTAEVYEFLWDVKKGDTVYIQLSSYAKLDGEIAIGFTGKAEVQEPTVYDEDEDLDGDFDRPEVEDVEAQEGDIGLFEFQIKRGLVDEENIDDEEISDLVNELKELCENEEFEKAATLLLPKLSFEFGTDQLDDDPGEFFADLDYIEIECTENNTSVKVGYDGDLVVTISVQFEIPLQAGISTQSLVDYLQDSGAWAAASVSPGWGYAGSDGDNVWFLGIKGKNSSPDSVMNMSALNFSSLGDAPYNWYLNMLRKFKDYDLAEEKFTECIDECLNENGFGGISWKELQAEQIQSLLDHLETLEMFNDPDLEEKVNGPLHSLIINAMVDAEAQRLQEETEKMSENTSNKKNTYSDDFKKEVAEAAQKPEATLASIGEQFSVSPTLVRNWKIKFSEEIDTADQAQEEKIGISVQLVQSWLQNSAAEGTIDNDGDLYVSTETTSETIMDEPAKLYLSGTQKLTAGGKSETSEISDQLTTNETNWLRSDFLKGVGSENTQFSYNLNCDVYGCAERVVVPLKLEKGKVLECPITAGQIGISKLNFVFEDGDFRAEGTITGPNGFIYAAEVLTEEPEEGHVPAVNKTADDEDSAEMYEFLWDVKKGDTVFVVLCAFEKLDGKLSCGFTGEAQIEEPISYDDDDDGDGFDAPEVEDVETNDGDVGLFEFQIKRGLVDEDEIEDEDVQKLVDELKQLCEDENYEEAAKLLLLNLSFEFGPGDLDDDPEMFFSSTEYIEFDCSSENTSVKIGYDDCLIVTISVQFEIPLNGGISTAELAEYLPDSGAWASASASPGWGYAGSDGDNVWFLEIKEKG